jgi:DNA polymerase III delta subunit
MLYLIHGKDIRKARKKVSQLVDQLLSKKPDASLQRISDENFDESYIDSYIGGQGLFESKQIIILDNLLGDPEITSAILPRLGDFKSSHNIFIFLEGTLLKSTLTRFEKHAEKIQHFDVPEERVKKRFDIFSLTDALGRRESKKLWVLYTTSKMRNISDEEIHGILFWQVKSMLLASGARDARDADLKPFVFAKAKSFAKNYTGEELKSLSSSLVSIYHDARRGKHELGSAMEQFMLGV